MIYFDENSVNLSDIFANCPNLVLCVLDAEYKYLAFNKKHQHLIKFAYKIDIDLNSSFFASLQNEEEKSNFKSALDKAFSGESFKQLTKYNTNGSIICYEHTYFPMKDKDSNVFAICIMGEEVKQKESDEKNTEKISELEEQVRIRTLDLEKANESLIEENEKRILTEKELNAVKSKIEESLVNEMELNKLKTKFISMVSHEFRTPLTIIQTAAFLLEKSYERQDEDKFRKNLEKINFSVDSMTQLMENILNFGKLGQGEIRASKQIFDINKEIVGLVNKNTIYNECVTLKLPDDPVYIDSDRILCNQIINNLLSNAVKYSAPKPEIKLYMTSDGYKCNISVVDNGIGIAKENIDSVLEAFKREDKISGIIQGTGLGLSIVKHNLDLLEGTIKIDSELEVGTTVTITIPR